MAIPEERRREHVAWLTEVTQIPTAAGRESRVVAFIERWVGQRADLSLRRDRAGNVLVGRREAGGGSSRPILVTAHLDHPAFVVERVVGPATLGLSFRGGVMDDYFPGTRVVVHAKSGPLGGVVTEKLDEPTSPFTNWLVDLDGSADAVAVGDVGTWDLPAGEVSDGRLHTNACDDLAAVAAALAMMDELGRQNREGEAIQDVRLLFTLAEEVGFIGAIAACREGTIPEGARLIALENSRSFPDSPIGGGPIVRVGDRMSVFSPALTAAVARRAQDVAGGDASVLAIQKESDLPGWRWQRKLMAGGACEASVFCTYGHEATCLCLPLGNYHNMGDLAAVQAGTNTEPATIRRECISISDFAGLVDLLVACGRDLPATGPMREKFEKLWQERSFVLGG